MKVSLISLENRAFSFQRVNRLDAGRFKIIEEAADEALTEHGLSRTVRAFIGVPSVFHPWLLRSFKLPAINQSVPFVPSFPEASIVSNLRKNKKFMIAQFDSIVHAT